MVSVPSTGDRVSRWTPTIFACAFLNFVLGQLLLVAGVSWPAEADTSGATFAAVHLLTIGWITLLMFGALFQFVPVLTSRALWSQRLSLATLLFIELGVGGMVGGFFLLGTAWGPLLPAGGGAVMLGMFAGSLNLIAPLVHKRPWRLSTRFVVAGLVLMVLTVIWGLSLALAFTMPVLAAAIGPIVASGVEYHVLAGIGGWFTLTAIGVSYELLPMFMLAPHDRGAWGRTIFWTALAGFATALAASLIATELADGFVTFIQHVGRIAIGAAMVLYLIDIGRMYRDRRRRQIELHNRAAVGAFFSLGVALAIVVAGAALNKLDRIAQPLVFLLIFGWLSGLGLSQLYKIVPFLAWLTRFGRRLGTGPVPRVQELVNERTAGGMFAVYFASVAVAAGAAFFDAPLLVRCAMAVAVGTTLLLGREYWRAWSGYYVRRRLAAPSDVYTSSTNKEAGHEHARATHT